MEKEKTLLDEVIENTINFIDVQGNRISLNAKATRRQYAPTATDAEWEQFVDTIEANGLDPRLKQVYFTKYNTKDGPKVSIVTGYQVYLARAMASGKLAKIPQVRVVKPDPKDINSWYGEVEITRNDMEGTAIWTTPMKEANKGLALWNIMPEFMLKKTTGPQGLRFYLADVIGGLPYTSEEIASGIGDIESIEQSIEPSKEEQAKLEKEKATSLEKIRNVITGKKTIAELEKWLVAQKSLETSVIKNQIIAIYQEYLVDLQVETLAKSTGAKDNDVRMYLEINGCRDIALLGEALAGNKEAIDGIAKAIVDFCSAYTARQSEINNADNEETELDGLADERASEA